MNIQDQHLFSFMLAVAAFCLIYWGIVLGW